MFIPNGVVLPCFGNLSFPQQSLNLFKASIPTEHPFIVYHHIPKQNTEHSHQSFTSPEPIPFGNQPSLVSPLIPSRVWYILISHRFPSRVWCLLSSPPAESCTFLYTPSPQPCRSSAYLLWVSSPAVVVWLYLLASSRHTVLFHVGSISLVQTPRIFFCHL